MGVNGLNVSAKSIAMGDLGNVTLAHRKNPLLTTKLHIPPTRANLVARPRLIARMNAALRSPLMLLSAPPGFGKTTLLTAWLDQVSLPAAWYSVDERDNDLTRFLTYLVAALGTVEEGAGQQALNWMLTRRKPALETVMTLLSNDIAAIPREFVLVLDDYHLIELQTIHEAMAFLLDHLPPSLHLVIASRADPPFPLTRLRARGQLVELRAGDLRFSPEEAATFLNQQMGLRLTPEQVAMLEERAEGWIAGLQLAALSMQGHDDVAGFVRAFTGSHRFVLDYLAEEVLARQTSEIQEFLLQTSILDRLNAGLADAVTGRTDGASTLAQLDKRNLFLIPLDAEREWYRYHHLFDDLLQNRLQHTRPTQIPELHRRASAWYEQSGFVNEAIDHALLEPDFERAAQLIEQVGLMKLMRSEDTTVVRWTTQLPDEVIRTRPLLALVQAGALMSTGNMELASARLGQVDESQLDGLARGAALLLRSALMMLDTNLPNALAALQDALAKVNAIAADTTDPQAEFNHIVALVLSVLLAFLQTATGQLHAAAETCQRCLELARGMVVTDPWMIVAAYTYIELAELWYEWNDPDASAQYAKQGLAIARAGRNQELEAYALVQLAQIHQLHGDAAGAYALVQQSAELVYKRKVASELRYVATRYAKIMLEQNRLDEAAQVMNALPSEDTFAWMFERGLSAVVRARLLLAQREFAAAEPELESIIERARGNGQLSTAVEANAVLALARNLGGDKAGARNALEEALRLAEPEGYVRTFVDLGEPVRFMIHDLRLMIRDEPLKIYADKLLKAFPMERESENQKSKIINHEFELAEPLSERELAVLRLISEGLSNQEIAEQLVVALSTVKTHINNIYSKLGVANRTQALARARELQLL